MKLSSLGHRTLFSSILLSASLLINVPAWATLEDNLKHMPQGADGIFSVDTTPTTWSYFLKKKPFSEFQSSDMWKEVKKELSDELGLDLDKDLLPMLGTHISLGLYSDGAAKDEEFPILVTIDTKPNSNPNTIFEHLKKAAAKDKESKALVESTHKGVKIYSLSRPGTNNHSDKPHLAVSKNTLLLGSQRMVHKAIEVSQDSKNIMTDSKFPGVYNAFKQEKMWAYFVPASLSRLATKMGDAKASDLKELAEVFKAFNLFDTMGVGLNLDQNGLSFRTFSQLKTTGIDPKLQAYVSRMMAKPSSNLGDLTSHAPGRPLFFGSMQGLDLLGSDAANALMPNDKDTQEILNMVREMVVKATGLDFKKDLQPIIDGRAGLAVFYPDNTKVFDRVPHVVMYLGVKDNAKFQAVLQSKMKLNVDFMDDKPTKAGEITFPKAAQAKYQGISLFMANDTPVVQGMKKEMGLQPGYAQLGNVWLLGSNIEALKAVIDVHKGSSAALSKNANYQAIQKRLGVPGAEWSTVYIDLGKAMDLANFFMGEEKEFQAVKEHLGNALRAIAAGSSQAGKDSNGFFSFDVDMEKINFEAIAKFFGDEEKPKVKEKAEEKSKPKEVSEPKPKR